MNDHQLRDQLRSLPAPRAGEGFTRTVLARLDAEPAATAWLTVPRLVTVAVAVVVVVLALSPTFRRPRVAPAPQGDAVAANGAGTGDVAGRTPQADPHPALPAPIAPAAAPGVEPEVAAETGIAAPHAADRVADAGDPPPAASAGGERRATDPTGQRPAIGRRIVVPPPDAVATGTRPASSPAGSTDLGSANPGSANPGAAYARLPAADRRQALERLAELRRQQQRLRDRLAALAASTAPNAAPALLVGGDESVELVVDLGPGADSGPGLPGGTRPARYRPQPVPRYH